jgi:hypothetical protein
MPAPIAAELSGRSGAQTVAELAAVATGRGWTTVRDVLALLDPPPPIPAGLDSYAYLDARANYDRRAMLLERGAGALMMHLGPAGWAGALTPLKEARPDGASPTADRLGDPGPGLPHAPQPGPAVPDPVGDSRPGGPQPLPAVVDGARGDRPDTAGDVVEGTRRRPGRRRAAAPRVTPPADDFDEHTPPPRREPHQTQGEALPAEVRLAAMDNACGAFWAWQHEGRVNPCAILLRFIGTACGTAGHSGYLLVCPPATGAGQWRDLGATAGQPIPDVNFGVRWRKTTTVRVGTSPPREFGVWVPKL